MIRTGLKPIIDNYTKILILGSLPGEESLKQQKYYAHKGNDFWKLLGNVLKNSFNNLSYKEKISILKKHHIGLWDSFYSSFRQGSMDSSMKKLISNDFLKLKNKYDNIKVIFFNGKKAAEIQDYIYNLGFKTFILPSSSGANRWNQIKRLKKWQKIKEFL